MRKGGKKERRGKTEITGNKERREGIQKKYDEWRIGHMERREGT